MIRVLMRTNAVVYITILCIHPNNTMSKIPYHAMHPSKQCHVQNTIPCHASIQTIPCPKYHTIPCIHPNNTMSKIPYHTMHPSKRYHAMACNAMPSSMLNHSGKRTLYIQYIGYSGWNIRHLCCNIGIILIDARVSDCSIIPVQTSAWYDMETDDGSQGGRRNLVTSSLQSTNWKR